MGWRQWTGVGERRWKTAPNEHVQPPKTLWDWLQLLIVPAILVAVTFAWSAAQTKSDNRREDRRIAADRAAAEQVRQDTTLSGYFKQMSDLVLHENLLTCKPGDAVRSLARTVTLTTVRSLDGERKGEIVRFLYEARLIGGRGLSLINLTGADLTHADLRGANLTHADLGDADLTQADLAGANLTGAVLRGAVLRGAVLRFAELGGAVLRFADLAGANLTGAVLGSADLTGANLTHAVFSRADLTGAVLRGAKGLPSGNR